MVDGFYDWRVTSSLGWQEKFKKVFKPENFLKNDHIMTELLEPFYARSKTEKGSRYTISQKDSFEEQQTTTGN